MLQNTINYHKSGSFGGTKEVFAPYAKNREFLVENGAILDSTQAPAYGERIYAGDFGYLDETTGKVKLLKTFKLKTALTAIATKVEIVQDEFSHVLHEGDILIVGGATGATAGAGITVGTLTAITGGVSFAITANDFGALDAGTIFVIAGSAHASTAVPAMPKVNVIFGATIPINVVLKSSNFQNDAGDISCYLYYHAVIMKEVVNIPTYVEALNKISNSVRYFEL